MDVAIVIIVSYLLGSIPFGLILTKLGGYGDIRDIGSGNIGATNVLRTGNKKLAAATLVLDAFKGVVAVVLVFFILQTLGAPCALVTCMEGTPCDCWNYTFVDPSLYIYLAAFSALIGHIFPVWLKFKGGKGVATALGILLALKPIIGIAACGIWILMAVTLRYSSLSALIAVASTPFLAHFLFNEPTLTGFCGVVASLIFFKHRANIHRLLKGEEPKIGQKK